MKALHSTNTTYGELQTPVFLHLYSFLNSTLNTHKMFLLEPQSRTNQL